jgi:hypothetical protein
MDNCWYSTVVVFSRYIQWPWFIACEEVSVMLLSSVFISSSYPI